MLREDKSAWIERVELITDAETDARNTADAVEGRVAALESQVRWDEDLTKGYEESLRNAPRPRGASIWEMVDGKFQYRKAQARRAHSSDTGPLGQHRRAALERLDVNRMELAAARDELAAAKEQLANAEATRISAYRLHGKDHFVDFPDDEYEGDAQTQTTMPVLITTWETRNWWWYAGRFWWDTERLDAKDVQALVLQRDKKKQATLERARADAFGSTTTDEQQVARRAPIPEAVRHEVWRRDQGRCVDCGSRENLEFDHIIPFSKGGSNTARNLELRCESCNRRKGATI